MVGGIGLVGSSIQIFAPLTEEPHAHQIRSSYRYALVFCSYGVVIRDNVHCCSNQPLTQSSGCREGMDLISVPQREQ